MASTVSSFPFEGQTTTETQYSYLFRNLCGNGVIEGASGTDLLVSNDPNNPFAVLISPGSAIVQGYMLRLDGGQMGITVPAPTAGTTGRFDMIVAHLDPAANTITIQRIAGSASAPPDLVQTDTGIYEIPLALIAVASTGVSVVDRRLYAPIRVGLWQTSSRPSRPFKGQSGINLDLLTMEVWNGSTWTPPMQPQGQWYQNFAQYVPHTTWTQISNLIPGPGFPDTSGLTPSPSAYAVNALTVPAGADGYYEIGGVVQLQAAKDGGLCAVAFYVNGAQRYSGTTSGIAGAGATTVVLPKTITKLNPGDVVTMWVYGNAANGYSLNTVPSAGHETYFQVRRVG